MKIRASLHLGETDRTLQIYPVLQETDDHLRLKLAACVLFHQADPLLISSPQQHDALAGQDFAPDLMTADDTNQVTLWIECGKTTAHKLEKSAKRFRTARMVMLLAHPHEAKAMAEVASDIGQGRIDVWAFKVGEFERWGRLVAEQTDIIGEADERSMNLVVNGEVFVTELERFS